jgi:hypothetical protein
MIGGDRQKACVWRRICAVAVWLGIVAVAFNGFAPGLQHLAMARVASGDAFALCTGDGSAGTPSPTGDHGVPSSSAADCCGLCILGGAALVAPSPIAAALPRAFARAEVPASATLAVPAPPTGPPLPARGPPHFS